MKGTWKVQTWLFLLMLAIGVPRLAAAAPFLGNFMTGDRIEADPNQAYRLKQENGPWMIMACSFSGAKEPRRQAHELVLELRKRYKLRQPTAIT